MGPRLDGGYRSGNVAENGSEWHSLDGAFLSFLAVNNLDYGASVE